MKVKQLPQHPNRRYCTQGICGNKADFVGQVIQKSGGPDAAAYCRSCLPQDAEVQAEPKEEAA